MRWLVLFATSATAAEMWPLEKLFTRPYVWGTEPTEITWSKKGHTLAFLWNEAGNRFLDLYAYHADSGKRHRLTNLEPFQDELLATDEEKDERRRRNLSPLAGISSFHLSNDGANAVFSYKGDLFLVPTDASREPFRLTRTRAPELSPQFSPDGNRLGSIRNGQLVVQDLATGQIWQVTDIEPPLLLTAYRWSPDGKSFLYETRRGPIRQIPLPNYSGRFVTAPPILRSVAGEEPVDYGIFVIPSTGGKPLAMELGDFGSRINPGLPEWSPDSTRLAWRTVHPDMKRQRILVLDAQAGKHMVAAEDRDEAWVFWSEYGWSPDSKQLWFTSERDGWAHIYTVLATGGPAKQITKGEFEARAERFTQEPQWIGDWIYFSSTEPGPSERHLYRIHSDGSGKEKLSSRSGISNGVVSEDGRHIAWMLADLNNPFDLWVGDRRVTTSPRAEFSSLPWPSTRFVTFPSRGDQQTVHAKLLLPPGYDPDRRGSKMWPCVFFIHGAGYATSVLKQWGSYNDLRYVYNAWLASQGYVVMDLDYRGSSGYGHNWRTGVYLHMGGLDLDDVLGAVDYLAALGNIDVSKLGIWGVSYGGFLTNMAMFRSPDTFKAGSSWAAVNEWEHYNAFYTTQRLTTPALNPEAYRRSSPIHFSHRLKNHLLIIHGMVDSNVLFQDAVQLTEKLVREGKDFSHVYYPQEDHAFVRDETWIDAVRRTSEWFARHLK